MFINLNSVSDSCEMSFSGKKFKKVDFKNVVEVIEALKIDEKIKAMLTETAATTCFTKNADGTWNYKVETPEKVLINETFALNQEFDYARPDGVVNKVKFWLEGETMFQTMTGTTGKSIHFERAYSGDKMTMTVAIDGLTTKAEVIYNVV